MTDPATTTEPPASTPPEDPAPSMSELLRVLFASTAPATLNGYTTTPPEPVEDDPSAPGNLGSADAVSAALRALAR